MQFKPKRDGWVMSIIGFILITLAAPFIIALIDYAAFTGREMLWLFAIIFVIEIVMIWLMCHIRYICCVDYLFVQSGPIRSRIKYENIFKVTPTSAIFTGYNVLNSRKHAIEIYYRHGVFGSVKIAPLDQARFLQVLQEKCPHARIEGFHEVL